MSVTQEAAHRIEALLAEAKRIVCICHKSPDGDAIGSLIGIGLLLEQQYPGIPVELCCIDPAPDTFSYLQATMRMQSILEPKEGDCIVFVDTAEPKLTGYSEIHPELFDGSTTSVNIDHHPSNSLYATENIVVPEACSACEVILDLAQILGWSLHADIATALLTGMYTDTGGLLHSNTTAKVYRTVADLLRSGAKQQEIVQAVFRTSKLSTLRLWGRVLEKISLTAEGGAISAVTAGDFRASGADFSELTGAIDYVNAIPGMRFSLILSERNGKVKGSLRTLREDVDVSAMASKFQGGGHKKAAGFALDGSLQPELRWKVVPGSGE